MTYTAEYRGGTVHIFMWDESYDKKREDNILVGKLPILKGETR